MLLTGAYARRLEKCRVAIPKPLRDSLSSHLAEGLFVAPGTDGSLAIYTESSLAQMAERLSDVSPAARNTRDFRRLFYAQATRTEIDKQGRIRLPAHLVQLAGLSGEVVLIGVQDHLELWDAARWNSYLNDRQSQYDSIAEGAFDPTIARNAPTTSAGPPPSESKSNESSDNESRDNGKQEIAAHEDEEIDDEVVAPLPRKPR